MNEGVEGRKVSTVEQEERGRQDWAGLSTTSSPNAAAFSSSIRHKAASARLVHRLLRRLQWCSGRLSGQDIATCYYALASLGVEPGAAGAALAAAVKQQVGGMNGQDVSSIMWAQAILNHDPGPLVHQPAPRAHHAGSAGSGSKSKDSRGGGVGGAAGEGGRLSARLGGSYEWRREEGGTRVEERLSWHLMQRASQLAHTLEVRHVCNIFWAAASLGLLSLLSPSSVGVWYKGRRWQTSLDPQAPPHMHLSCARYLVPCPNNSCVSWGTRGEEA